MDESFIKEPVRLVYMEMRKALTEAIINGLVIGALVAGVMILSNQVSNIVIMRTTGAAILMRFSFYMIENVDWVEAGAVGKYLGLPQNSDNGRRRASFSSLHLGKLI